MISWLVLNRNCSSEGLGGMSADFVRGASQGLAHHPPQIRSHLSAWFETRSVTVHDPPARFVAHVAVFRIVWPQL